MIVLGIDQSLNATGLCVLDTEAGEPLLLETLPMEKEARFEKVQQICNHISKVATTYRPTLVAMEDYARQAHSSSLIPLVELGGCIKLMLWGHGFNPGNIHPDGKAFFIQNQSNMKKFMLGDGAAGKTTAYLLEVFEKLKRRFVDDNQADAYMHAMKAALAYKVLRGEVKISNLHLYQQEALISVGVKRAKGLSLAKALKLPDEEKIKFVRI